MTDVRMFVNNTAESIEHYFISTNQILGLMSVAIGLGCLSTANPKSFGLAGSIFVLLTWINNVSVYRNKVRILSIIQHEKMSPYYLFKRCHIALLGWAFLTAIAFGIVDGSGVVLFSI